MTWTIDIEQLEALEPRLKALVEFEGQIVLTHDGEPIAVLVPVQSEQQTDDHQAAQSPSR